MDLIAQGAEAKLYRTKEGIVKDRIKKDYRIKQIDDSLRKFRTKREAKVLEKLKEMNFPAPRLIKTDEKEKIVMEDIKGHKVRDILEKSDYKKLCFEIGEKVGKMHSKGIMHGDLTTSNMILNKEVYFIDFGLSFFSDRIEDNAVDLHLFRQALASKHYTIADACFKEACKGYKKTFADKDKVFKRLEIVEGRGRNKGKS